MTLARETAIELYQKANDIVSKAEIKYEHQRCLNDFCITPEMEEEWYKALRTADMLNSKAAEFDETYCTCDERNGIVCPNCRQLLDEMDINKEWREDNE